MFMKEKLDFTLSCNRALSVANDKDEHVCVDDTNEKLNDCWLS